MKQHLLLISALCLFVTISAQVQIDKDIQLTGSGTNARISGIKTVIDSLDATSVKVVQNGSLIYALATGGDNAFSISISPAFAAYQAGMVFNFISNQVVTGPATLNVNGLGPVSIVKYINQALTGCEIQTGQVVTVVYDGTNFQMTSLITPGSLPTTANAGSNQSSVVGAATLAGNSPSSGTGLWTIISGTGGNIASPSSPASPFTGTAGSSYVLQWTISNSCATSTSTVNISFAFAAIYTTPGTDTLIVPAGVTSVNIQCWGAQGADPTYGGLGGMAAGTLAVSSGEALYVFVGGQSGANGGGLGGSSDRNGGDESDVRVGGIAISNWVIVAGGGGGTGNTGSAYGGGAGGGGSVCANGAGGGGGVAYNGGIAGDPGTCTSGGSAGSSADGWSGGGGGGGLTTGGGGSAPGSGGYGGNNGGTGTQGQGGNYGSNSCTGNNGAGGGGGYYGGGGSSSGGGCAAGSGGGGSSWASASMTNTSFSGGVQSGNGKVVLIW